MPTSTLPARRPITSRPKMLLWGGLGLTTLFVFVTSELFLVFDYPMYHAYRFSERILAPAPDVVLTTGIVTAPTEVQAKPSHRLRWILAAASLVIALVLYKAYPSLKGRAPARNPLWAQMMAPGESTLFIAADSSLVLMHHYFIHGTTLADYTSGRYLAETVAMEKTGDEPNGLSHRHLTSMVDLQLGQFLERTPIHYNSSVQSLYARDVNLEELKKSNVILSGSLSANPWLELYLPRMNFVFGKNGVENRKPQAGEPAMYLPEREPDQLCYGVLAFLPGLNAAKNVLIVEGTTQAGTEAITDLLFDQRRMQELLRHIPTKNGELSHFEILLDATHMYGNSGVVRVVSQHVFP